MRARIDLERLLLEVIALGRTERKQAETIGERLARLRRERGITQVELAEMLGVVQPMISDYERGLLRLHGELIVQLTGFSESRPMRFWGWRLRPVRPPSKTGGCYED